MYLGHGLDLPRSGRVTSSVTWSFCGMWFPIAIPLTPIRYLELFARYSALNLSGSQPWPWGHVTTSVTWPFNWPCPISYRCSIRTDNLSPSDFEILRLKCIWVTVLPFLSHVTSSVTWSFFPRYVVSYTCSIDSNPLAWGVCELLSLKHIWVATLTFRVTWRHRSRDRSIGRRPFPIGVPLVLTLHLQMISRYWGSNVSSSRFWPF